MYKALDQSIRNSEKLADLSDFTYRVWAQGLAASDMVGRITANPRKFWAQAMPLSGFDKDRYEAAFQELVKASLIHLYTVEGKVFMLYHEHDDYNKGTKNLRNIHPECPPPPPNTCYCVVYAKSEETGPSLPVTQNVAPVISNDPPEDMVRPAIRHLYQRAKEAKIAGRKDTLLSYIESWVARTDAQRVEQNLMDPWARGKTVLEIQEHFFNGKEGKSWDQIIKEASNGSH